MQKNKNGFFISILLSAGLSVICALIGILIFALIVKFTNFNSGVIKAVNQFLKVIAIFIGCFFILKQGKGAIKGLLSGIIFTIILYLIFSLIGGSFNFGVSFIVDLLFCAIIGAICGIISVNVKKDY